MEIGTSMTGKVTEKLFDRIWNEIQYLFTYEENKENLEKNVNMLETKFERVKILVDEAEENVKRIYSDVENWVKRVETVKKEANEILQGKVQMNCFYIRFPNIKKRYSLCRKAIKLSNEIKVLILEGSEFGTEMGYRTSKDQNEYFLPHNFEKFESRSVIMKKVLEKLKDSETRVIGICGMPGVGKTKLAMEIEDKVKVENLFEDVTFATVSSTIDVKKIQGELAAGLKLDISEVKDSPLEVAKLINQRLKLSNTRDNSSKKKRNILVILDDVWENQNLDLTSLGIPIKNGAEGLKLMITSRFRHVCARLGATNEGIIEVDVMQQKEACLLFKEIVGISDDEDDDDLKKIAEEVAKECGGLPLAIVCIGGLLKNKKNLYIWEDVLKQLRDSNVAILKGEKNLAFSRIEFSYQNLQDVEYKSLLLLCSIFPEDSEIYIETLVRYVKGLEVFEDGSKLLTMMETRSKVETVVDYLKDCGLVNASTKIRRCVKLHDVVRDLCLSILKTKETEGGQGVEGSSRNNMIRFTSTQILYCGKESKINIFLEGWMKKDVKVVDVKPFSMEYLQLSSLLQCYFKSLRQLCLERIQILKDLPCIRLLQTLEILSFFKSLLARFPEEVAELKNLKLLDLRFNICHRFPLGIFLELKKLEELYMGLYIPGGESIENAKMAWIKEARSLSNLTTFQIRGELEHILPMLTYLNTKKIERFEIVKVKKKFDKDENFSSYSKDYEVKRCMELDGTILKPTSLDFEEDYNIDILVKKSNTLRLAEMKGLRNVVPELDEDGLTNLKTLVLKDSSDVEYIVDSLVDMNTRKKVLHNLRDPLRNIKKLMIDRCENLKSLISSGGGIQPTSRWLCNLKFVQITRTKVMASLFSHSNMKLFAHLEELHIMDCPALENIIDMDTGEEQGIIEFPRLKALTLGEFIELKGFNLPKNNKNNIWQALFNKVSLPSLVVLTLYKGKLPPNIIGPQMSVESLHNLRTIYLQYSKGFACIANADSLRLLENLETYCLIEVQDAEVVFDFEGLKVMPTQILQLLGQLTILTCVGMPQLTSIWRMFPQTGIHAFKNLKTVELYNCTNIPYLLPASLIQMLISLEEIRIVNCHSMENVINDCFEGGKGNNNRVVSTQEHIITSTTPKDHFSQKQFVFPKLSEIRLEDLEKLRSFNPNQDFILFFPFLTSIKVLKCPQLKNLSTGKLSTPNLKSLEGDVIPYDLQEFVATKKEDTEAQ